MMLNGSPATAPRMLLLDRVDFEPGCYVFDLDRPLFLAAGDQIWAERSSVVVLRAVTGSVERPAGSMTAERWAYKLL
ncbi:hypothetical protein [Streptomyces sp. NRRL S-350]|uniref:hypothetical protein n=1 Tax=Streptomyces sp. NRRL S-350 TaxID=1463902 RepID=UPI00131D4437|nr:hypothetical protein [Streptomyces sp. NRRL S-350]